MAPTSYRKELNSLDGPSELTVLIESIVSTGGESFETGSMVSADACPN